MEHHTLPPAEAAGQALSGPEALETVLAGLEQRLDRLVETRLAAAEARRRDDQRQALTERFAAEHPDFLERKADGTLDALRAANPLLDDVGAYLSHRLADERRQLAQAVDRARQETAATTEAALLERFKAKRLAATLDTALGSAGRGQGLDPELGAPERFGGLTAVLAARLEARRKTVGN